MDGYRFRPATLDDIKPVADMIAESDRFDYGEVTFFEADLDDFMHRPRMVLETDTWVVEDESGNPAAFGWVWTRTEHEHVVTMGVVHPDHRGRGLGAAIAGRMEQRGSELLADAPAGKDAVITSAVAATDPTARALLEARGYREVRRFWRMRRHFDGPVEVVPDPPGVVVRVATEDDARMLHEVIETAFMDHFRPRYEPFDEWLERNLRHERRVWFLATADGEPAGALTGSFEEGKGHVDQIGVLRDARRRGVAAQLLRKAFAVFADGGVPFVELDVDSENRTGATALYESVGMSQALSYLFFDKIR